MDTSQSHSRRVLGQVRGRVTYALRRSTVGSVLGLAERSFLYRWLTSEPEPDVVVIDLRDTHTVGPLLRAVDSVTQSLERAWHQSRFEAVADAVSEQLDESYVGRLLKTVLWPPESSGDRNQ